MEDFEKLDKKFVGDVIDAVANKHISPDQAKGFILDRMSIYRGGALNKSISQSLFIPIVGVIVGFLFANVLMFILK